uniref:Aconitase A/isopropylmalate dehydratase small subunit swivel domain-containing protein n=1 Tax=Ananas comosus var. bracteatus TaxID=296719 RepID=A0A6V7QPA0_ANACO|nr:unnamed protein product [Ananas comosus var. bracteatus]
MGFARREEYFSSGSPSPSLPPPPHQCRWRRRRRRNPHPQSPDLSSLPKKPLRLASPPPSASHPTTPPPSRTTPPPSSPPLPEMPRPPPPPPRAALSSSSSSSSSSPTLFHGPCFVLGDNIDTDQIIPAEHLTLVPSNPDEYAKLGSHAFCGLPSAAYPVPFVAPGAAATRFPVVIAGANFGCGSSREHAPVALGAAGVGVVVAESYARIFFRNSVATGEVYPLEVETEGLHEECTTGDVVTVDLEKSVLINHTTGREYRLKPIGDAGPVIEAGGSSPTRARRG